MPRFIRLRTTSSLRLPLPAAYRSIRPSESAGTNDEISIALGDVHAGEIHAHDAYGLVQRRHGAVMKIRSRQFDVAQVRDLEAVQIFSLAGKTLEPSSEPSGLPRSSKYAFLRSMYSKDCPPTDLPT